jgi:hypothetical protein
MFENLDVRAGVALAELLGLTAREPVGGLGTPVLPPAAVVVLGATADVVVGAAWIDVVGGAAAD